MRITNRTCSVEGCDSKHFAKGYCFIHYDRMRTQGRLDVVKRPKGSGFITKAGYLMHGQPNGRPDKFEHVLVAEKALGKLLPKGAKVHHVDGNKLNNDPCNLVICPSQAYHLFIERRTRAFNACGNADYYRCTHCGKWDDPVDMTVGHGAIHKECRRLRYAGLQ